MQIQKGIQLAILTMLISGFSIFASKFFVSKMDPVLFTTLKNGLVAVILTAYILATKKHVEVINFSKSTWSKLLLVGILGGGIAFALFFTGLTQISALEGALIHKTLFIWVLIFSFFIFKERLNKFQILAYLLVTVGALAFGGASNFQFNSGYLLVGAATILWSIEYIIAKNLLKTVSPVILSWARMTIGLAVLVGITFFQGNLAGLNNLSTPQILAVASGAVFLLAYVLTWYRALAHARASVVSLVLAASPIITGLLTAVFVSKTFPQSQFVSWLAIAVGILIYLLSIRHQRQLQGV